MVVNNALGLPDWLKLDGYPQEDAPMSVWAWEFLRRSPSYRSFWKEKVEPFCEKIKTMPLGQESEVIGRNAAGELWPYLDELRMLFGVDVPSPPHSSTPASFVASWIRYTQDYSGRGFECLTLAENEIAYVFDLARPLKPQFEHIQKHAENRQVSMKVVRRRTDKYAEYLRILDAIEAGEKSQVIADHFFSDKSDGYPENPRLRAFYDARDAALRMRDGGYKAILG
jgi:hypothetical protein